MGPGALTLLLLTLAACEQAPRLQGDPPAAIVMRWDDDQAGPPSRVLIRWKPDVTTTLDPRSAADEHCLAWNRVARKVSEESVGATRIAEFVCIPPSET